MQGFANKAGHKMAGPAGTCWCMLLDDKFDPNALLLHEVTCHAQPKVCLCTGGTLGWQLQQGGVAAVSGPCCYMCKPCHAMLDQVFES
jgi:hypothetical protein